MKEIMVKRLHTRVGEVLKRSAKRIGCGDAQLPSSSSRFRSWFSFGRFSCLQST